MACGQLPDLTRGRTEIRRLTAQSFVPVLMLDDGHVVTGSAGIVARASENRAPAAT